ncbi:hypothetical protein HNP84_006335 [Thermocatellispora tengchongensis]|uniref:Uncharacterized protein n=1 Tax=Thermocatellispora tengchongensis TaxID=1073253 RepID=A0A840PAB7_9ACTN|nr:hypothetical protein [Thermocatellispora tengchongensis]MBB5136588.1 hypothetical protein [Thermocatellispora tengchongensis]
MSGTHVMIMVDAAATGGEEWYCPECGRRLIIRWEPQFAKVVLEPGNDLLAHFGGKGGVRKAATPKRQEPSPLDIEWLRRHGISWTS